VQTIPVKSVKWNLEPSFGRLYPVLYFDKVTIGKTELSQLTLRTVTDEHKQAIIKKISFQPNAELDIEFKVEESTYSEPPHKCYSCLTKLKSKGGELYCINQLCPEKAITSLWRLFEATGRHTVTVKQAKNYFSLFPLGRGNHTNILNVLDKEMALVAFLNLFRQIGPKNILNRQLELERTFAKCGKDLWEIEVKLDLKITKDGLTFQEFWYILNLPGITYGVANSLIDVNPETIRMEIEYEERKILKELPAEIVASLVLWKPYWCQVLSRINLTKG
jgi:hypothetical protein